MAIQRRLSYWEDTGEDMRLGRLLVIITCAAALTTSFPTPKPARAADAGEVLLWTTVAIVGWVSAVFAGTALVYRRAAGDVFHGPLSEYDSLEASSRVRFGQNCSQTSMHPTWMCW
jgi:hypothetical protein